MKSISTLLLAALLSPPVFASEDPGTAVSPPPAPPPRGVSAAPNRTVVIGKVAQQCALLASALGIQPEMTIFRVRMTGVQWASGNPLRRAGTLLLLSKEEVPLLVGSRARATIEYRGDEKGGAYWLRSIEKVE